MYLMFEGAPFIGWIIDQKVLIYAIAGGVFLAYFAYWFVQSFIGGLVRKMLENGVGEENAKTLSELEKSSFLYKWFLRNGSTLRNLVSCVGGDLKEIKKAKDGSYIEVEKSDSDKKLSFKEKVKSFFLRFKPKIYNFENAKFYISQENEKKARDRHSRAVNPLWLPLMLVLCAAAAFGMTYLLPIIMDYILN